MRFRSGVIVSLTMRFDVQASQLPFLEVYGARGTLSVPDPKTFAGPVRVCPEGSAAFVDRPLKFPFEENSRGLGLSDMADGIRTGRTPRASGGLALHVLETMRGMMDSVVRGDAVGIERRPERPSPMRRL